MGGAGSVFSLKEAYILWAHGLRCNNDLKSAYIFLYSTIYEIW